MSNPYDISDSRCNAWYKGYDVAMKKAENQFSEKVDLKKENAELKKLVLQEKQNVQTLKTVIEGMKKMYALEQGLIKGGVECG